jgi:chromosome segregation ATPase
MFTDDEAKAIAQIRSAVEKESATLRLRRAVDEMLDAERFRELGSDVEEIVASVSDYIGKLESLCESLTDRAERLDDLANVIDDAQTSMAFLEDAVDREEKADARDEFLEALTTLLEHIDALEDGDLDDPASFTIEPWPSEATDAADL